MSLSATQISLVQASWEQCVSIADTAADLFYTQLFTLDPDLRTLFPEDMAEQKSKLMTMITTAVRALNNLEAIVPSVQAHGKRHKGYRVTPEMYDTVGAALLWTLEQGLGDSWNEELKVAWTAVYTLLADTMKSAAAEA